MPMKQQIGAGVEFYTPQYIIDRAIQTFGEPIELDPATCAIANRVVGAKRGYTSNGLVRPWTGRTLWLNPPYTRAIGRWVQRWLDAVAQTDPFMSSVNQAISLLPARTDTKFFHMLRKSNLSLTYCFVEGRIKFIKEDGSPSDGSGMFPSVLVYCGPFAGHYRFRDAFKDQGAIMCLTD